MVRIELKDVFIIILVIILLIGGIYGTYLLYIDPNHKDSGLIGAICMIISVLIHLIAFASTCMLIQYLSTKTITINTIKIKEKLKQLIK